MIQMINNKKKYLTDEKKRPDVVQIDIETFEKMEQLFEDLLYRKDIYKFFP